MYPIVLATAGIIAAVFIGKLVMEIFVQVARVRHQKGK